MLDNATVQKLHDMKLGVMATKFKEQIQDNAAEELNFEERFGFLVDAEWAARKNNRLSRLIYKASFEFPNACLEDVEYHSDRKLNRALVARLGTCASISVSAGISSSSAQPETGKLGCRMLLASPPAEIFRASDMSVCLNSWRSYRSLVRRAHTVR